nr:immunoglobulin light chain junction region [Macaca mulatta]
CRQGYDNPLTF